MKCKIKQIKCAVLTIMLLSFTCMSFRINAQNTQMQHWYMNYYSNSVDVDFGSSATTSPPYNSYSYLVTDLPVPSSGYTHRDGAVNGMYDMNGNLIFYVEDGTVFDKNGVNKGTFQYTGNSNTNEIAIVPFNSTCLEYYVIISTFNKSPAHARVLYGKVTLDDNYNVTAISNEGLLGGYSTNINVGGCSFAVSNSININGDKYLYVVEGDFYNSSNYYGYLKKFLLSDNGISFQQTILDGSVAGQKLEYEPLEVELNHEGTQIAWGSSGSYEKAIYNVNVTTGLISKYNSGIGDFPHGVEYSPDGTKLFFTEAYGGNNVKYIDLTTNQITGLVAGSGNSSHIELGPDGILYTSASSIDPVTLALNQKNLPVSLNIAGGIWHFVSALPDQIDGYNYYNNEHIKTCCAESYPYTINLGIGITTSAIWTATSNPFQNGTSTISMEEGFEIASGTTVEIQNMNFEFGIDAKVVVHTGGKLILNGTTFSGLQDCNTLWQGVVVEGTTAYTQSQELNQGVFEMINDSYIKNARIGLNVAEEVSTGIYKGGGIIKIQQAHFINNHIDIWMRPYELTSTTTYKPLEQESYIKDSYFTEDQNLIKDKYGNEKTNNIILWGIHGLDILGNTFENTNLTQEISKRGIGIMSAGSSFNVEPYCDPNITPCSILSRNEFNSLFYGIVCYEGIGSNNVIRINDNIFDNTYRSIILSGTYNAVVTSNTLTVPDYSHTLGISPYGIYINGGRDFKIEENIISSASNSQMINGARGIIVHNTGAVNNEIYNNECYNLSLSFQSQCFNSGPTVDSDVGLKYFCNISETGSNYSTDFWINNLSSCSYVQYSVIGPPMPRVGIAKHQRRPNLYEDPNNNFDDFYAADDRFTLSHETLSPTTKVDINNEDNYWLLWYWHGDGYTGDNENWHPRNYNWDNVCEVVASVDGTGNSHCPSKLDAGNNTLPDLYLQYNATKVKLNSAELILSIWKDGGNVELGDEVATTEPWEAYLQFNELMGTSPYLSDEVLIEIINNPVFSDLMVKLLMIANPQSIRSLEVMDALENRVPSMPQAYINEIKASDDGTLSQLELLEANVSSYNHAIDMIGQNIKRNYQSNFVDSWAKDSLIALISRGNDLNDKFELAITYLEFEDYTNMQNTINYISNNFELENEMFADFNDFQTLLNIAKLLKQSNYSLTLTQEQKLSLEAIFTNDAPLIGAMALSVLKRNDKDYIFNEQINNLSQTSSRLSHKHVSNSEYIQSSEYKLYPNPASDFTTISYDCLNSNISYSIYDVQGRILITKTLPTLENNDKNEVLIDLSTLSPGAYQFIIQTDNGIDWAEKLIVN